MGRRIGSLFSGAGGLDLAVQEVFGGDVVWHAEIDKAASKVLAYRFPGVPNLGDISAVDWAEVPAVDVLCGGFPCQDVSAAGRRAGIKAGTRSGLWSVFADAIDALRPQWVVIENVRGLLSATAHRTVDDADSDVEPSAGVMGDGAGRPVLRAAGAVLGDLADLGYDAQWATVAAADVGAPHRRGRVFILATDTSISSGAGLQQQDLSALQQRRGDRRPRKSRVCDCGNTSCGTDASDSARNGWDEGRPGLAGIVGGFDAAVSGDESGVALLPTPAAGNFNDGEDAQQWLERQAAVKERLNNGNGMGMPLSVAVQLLPTPNADVGRGVRSPEGIAKRVAKGDKQFSLEDAVALLPTPQRRDGEAGASKTVGGIRPSGQPRQKDLNTVTVRELGVERGLEPVEIINGEDDGAVSIFPCDGGSEDSIVVATDGEGVAVDICGAENSHNSYVPLLPTPRSLDCFGAGQHGDGGIDLRTTISLLPTPNSAWGKYDPAIRRWEALVGPAPAPTEPNKNGNPRLSAAFSEWLMGWPAGWVTDPAIGISRNDQLRIIGNGVCPQQAIASLHFLLAVASGTHTHTPRRADMTELLPTPTSRDHKGPNQRGDTTCLHGAINSEVGE